MRVLFLHGAIKNAGDFLIAHRSQLLVKKIIPAVEIISVWEGEKSNKIEEIIKNVDGIIFGGGPFFTSNIYPGDIPFVSNINDLKIPMINIGGGWFGVNDDAETIKNYQINNSSMELLRKIQSDSTVLSCRDWHTVNMLKLKGFEAEMHGCPAWYDIDYMDMNSLRSTKSIETICISDPANINNTEAARVLVRVIKKAFPNANIKYIFHRGTWEEEDGKIGLQRKAGIEKTLLENNIEWLDISGGYKGFEVYDSCDLHIGFRVHAHIYNLSHRNRSILIEEDGRGSGVNQALGLSSVYAYNNRRIIKHSVIRKVYNRMFTNINPYLEQDITLQLERMKSCNYLEYETAFRRMQFYYKNMCSHIKQIEGWQNR